MIQYIWIGIPCSSWSRARRGGKGQHGFPGPLRGDSAEEIWGLDGLSRKDQERVLAGNRLARWTARLFRHAAQHGVPVVVENPQTSRLWLAPPFKALLDEFSSVDVCHCAFGSPWRKPTKLLCAHAALGDLTGSCTAQGPNKLCENSWVPHLALSGVDQKGVFCTAKASAYPMRFCRAIAAAETSKRMVAGGLSLRARFKGGLCSAGTS